MKSRPILKLGLWGQILTQIQEKPSVTQFLPSFHETMPECLFS